MKMNLQLFASGSSRGSKGGGGGAQTAAASRFEQELKERVETAKRRFSESNGRVVKPGGTVTDIATGEQYKVKRGESVVEMNGRPYKVDNPRMEDGLLMYDGFSTRFKGRWEPLPRADVVLKRAAAIATLDKKKR